MKTTTLLALILWPLSLVAQVPATMIRTNQQIAVTITNQTAYTYAGTNSVDATRYSQVALQLSFGGTNASTGNAIAVFKRSCDGTNYETAAPIVWTVPITGLTPVLVVTNLNLDAIGYLKLWYITNSTDADLTNCTLFGYIKGYRRD